MNEMTFNEQSITITDASITFADFEELKERASQFANQIELIEVTEGNIKDVKKQVAAVRKDVDMLEKIRKEVKKRILIPYDIFAEQVKEITESVVRAETSVRNKVWELEEREREEKQKQIEEIWTKRNAHYNITLFGPEAFLRNEFMNKAFTMKTIESRMVEWFEQVSSEIELIKTMPNADAILNKYRVSHNLTSAINETREEMAAIKRIAELENIQSEPSKNAIVIASDADFTKVIKYMKSENIEFELL